MKIDIFGGFKLLNELYAVRKMSTAERILIRQKKDLINYLAIHLGSFIKAIIVIALLVLLTKYPDRININYFWIYLLTGLFFLVFDSLGFRALVHLIKTFFIQMYKLLIQSYYNYVKKYFQATVIKARKYKILRKCLFWFISFIFFIFPILAVFIILSIHIIIYAFVFLLITVVGNEALSLFITHTIYRIVPLISTVSPYLYYGGASIIIYFLIDYRIRQTAGALVVEKVVEDGKTLIEGLELKNTNNKISIFYNENKYLVFNEGNSQLTNYI